jgi:hypothetical protein
MHVIMLGRKHQRVRSGKGGYPLEFRRLAQDRAGAKFASSILRSPSHPAIVLFVFPDTRP